MYVEGQVKNVETAEMAQNVIFIHNGIQRDLKIFRELNWHLGFKMRGDSLKSVHNS